MDIHRILFATDYSDASCNALKLASSLAKATGAALIICHVSDLEKYPVGELFDEEYRPPAAEMNRLREVTPTEMDVPFERHLEHEESHNYANAIARYAGKVGADLIVVGTHGRQGLSRLLAGSVAESVVRRASCPVLTVKSSDGLRSCLTGSANQPDYQSSIGGDSVAES